MIGAGILGGPGIGYFQDYASVQEIQHTSTYSRYESYKVKKDPTATDYYVIEDGKKVPDEKAWLAITGLFPKVAGLDGARVGVLIGEPGEDNAKGKTLATDLQNFEDKGGKLSDNPPLYNLDKWWIEEGKPNEEIDYKAVSDARLHGGKQALTWTAYVPAMMAIGYLFLVIYFVARGGYKAEVLVGHAAEDERFTGGTEGPGEG